MTAENITKFILPLFPIFTTIVTLIALYTLIRMSRSFFSLIKNLQDQIDHIYILIDSMAGGVCSPMHRSIYLKLRKLSPAEAKKASKDKGKFLRSVTTEGYVETRDKLKKIIEATTDPLEVKKFEGAIEELDGIFNLLDTIDHESDPEHINKIMENVLMSVDKLRNRGLDIEIGGMSC